MAHCLTDYSLFWRGRHVAGGLWSKLLISWPIKKQRTEVDIIVQAHPWWLVSVPSPHLWSLHSLPRQCHLLRTECSNTFQIITGTIQGKPDLGHQQWNCLEPGFRHRGTVEWMGESVQFCGPTITHLALGWPIRKCMERGTGNTYQRIS